MEFEKLIADRYSVRKFKKDNIEQSVVDKILDAGHKAPTGCNNQPQRIIVVNNEASMNKLRKCTKCHFDAPAAMIVCYNVDESWVRPYDGALSAPVDGAIVATHMMLEAHNQGIGCCWVMHFNPESLREAFLIPENVNPLAILIMGYPDAESGPIELHYKYRDKNEIIYYDTF